MGKRRLRESDLYKPVRDYLVANGYIVQAEVKGCDIAAVKGDDLIIVELKRGLTVGLLTQATARQKITDSVYVAIPAPKQLFGKRWNGMQGLIRQLELGLILVFTDGIEPRVQVAFHPLPYDRKKRSGKRRAIIQEIAGRSGEYNKGGITGEKLITAYRENAIHIACCLEALGPSSPKRLRQLDTGQKTLSILCNNVYGWFERVDKGIYSISARGRLDIKSYPELAEKYRMRITSQIPQRSSDRPA